MYRPRWAYNIEQSPLEATMETNQEMCSISLFHTSIDVGQIYKYKILVEIPHNLLTMRLDNDLSIPKLSKSSANQNIKKALCSSAVDFIRMIVMMIAKKISIQRHRLKSQEQLTNEALNTRATGTQLFAATGRLLKSRVAQSAALIRPQSYLTNGVLTACRYEKSEAIKECIDS